MNPIVVPAIHLAAAVACIALGVRKRSPVPAAAGAVLIALLKFPGAAVPIGLALALVALVVAGALVLRKQRANGALALAIAATFAVVGVLRVPWGITALFQKMAPDAAPTALLPAKVTAQLAQDGGELIESLDVDAAGNTYVSVMTKSTIRKIAPDGTQSALWTADAGDFDAKNQRGFVAALVVGADGAIYANVNANGATKGRAFDAAAVNGVWRVDTTTGKGELYATVPMNVGLNGIALGDGGDLYLADSVNDSVWRVDAATHETRLWVKNEALSQVGYKMLPGPNGVKVHDGKVYVSNTSKAQLVSFDIGADGTAGPAHVVATGLPSDDFAFGDDGTIYATTHAFNTIVAVRNDGTRAVVADEAHGVVGPTSAVFGKTAATRGTLYVCGDGNFLYPGWRSTPAIVAIDVGTHPATSSTLAAR